MRISLLAGFLLCAATLIPAQTNADWSYQGKSGPLLWGRLSPDYDLCSKGHEQSPIDIQKARLNPALQPIQFHYVAGPVTLQNTGHTVEGRVDPGSYIIANGVRYDLIRFNFHHPSEHTIKRKLSDMEIHLVHRSADGKLAVVAVFLSEDMGFPNATLATLWEHLPTRAGQTEKITDMVNPGGLLPADRTYWTYTGSLTTPPCTEGVSWFVYQQKISMSRGQYNAFAALYKNNARPTQDLRGRKIETREEQ
jgi:carbonic anhydrase